MDALEQAHAAARRQAEQLGHADVTAYHYRLASDALMRSLRGRRPSAATAAIVAVVQACDAECSRRTQAAPGYGTAG